MREQIHVLDVPFDVVTLQQATERVKYFLNEEGQHIVCTPNPEIVMEAQKDEILMNILKAADLVVPDGIGVVWASRYSKKKLTERVAGYDLVQNIFEKIQNTEHSVYFFGGAPGVSLAAAKKMKQKYSETNKKSIAVYLALRILVIICMVFQILAGSFENALMCILVL